jgi:DNA-binding MarR family transcriptional regulator
MADDLEGMGALRRLRDHADRRRQTLAVTPKGRAMLRQAYLIAQEADEQLLAALATDERSTLLKLLRGIAAEVGLPHG